MLHNKLNSVNKSCSPPTSSLGTCGGASQALPRNDQRKASDPANLRIGRENTGQADVNVPGESPCDTVLVAPVGAPNHNSEDGLHVKHAYTKVHDSHGEHSAECPAPVFLGRFETGREGRKAQTRSGEKDRVYPPLPSHSLLSPFAPHDQHAGTARGVASASARYGVSHAVPIPQVRLRAPPRHG